VKVDFDKTNNDLPIKMWLDDIEDVALDQARNLAKLPFAFRHIALMPDAHKGYGMPIGGVMATKGVIIPYAVGMDVGCGMCAAKTQMTDISTEDLKKVMRRIRQAVPVGKNWHKEMQEIAYMPKLPDPMYQGHIKIAEREYAKARKQIGTLGGGNHFIEIQKGSDGHIWLMVHSGSRNLGYQVANYYNKLAIELNQLWFSSVPKSWELAFLPLTTDEGKAYMAEMNYCVEYAQLNRALMMNQAIRAICSEGLDGGLEEELLDVAHNYAARENHFGENVVVHRKGATRAREGEVGIIPGSQGTNSFIVEGKGNPESFESCSHGAGRKMGRRQAERELDLDEQKKLLDDQGIVHSVRNKGDLEEAPGAYKDIQKVMANQADLVDIKVELKPLAVIKG